MVKAACALAALALLVLCLLTGKAPTAPLPLGLLALLALSLELTAVPLGGFGWMSAAPAANLALALTPGLGPASAAFVASGAILLRSLLRDGGRPGGPLQQGLADLLPALAGASAVTLALRVPSLPWPVMAVAGLVAYLLAASLIPPALARDLPLEAGWEERRRLAMGLLVGAAFGGPGLALLMTSNPWNGLWLLPMLLGVHRAAVAGNLRLSADEEQSVRDRERKSRQALAETQRKLSRTSRELVAQTEERVLLEDLVFRLAVSPDLDTTLGAVLDSVAANVVCDSAALFLWQEDRLVPCGWRSVHDQALRAEALTRTGEPVVEACWLEGKVTVARLEHLQAARLFPGEQSAAALPLGREGVLYVGRKAAAPFSEPDRVALSMIAGQGGLGIQSARRLNQTREALALHAREHARQKVWGQRLAYLLEGSRALASNLSVEAILGGLQRLLTHTLQPDLGAVLASSRPGTRSEQLKTWPEPWPSELTAAVWRVAEVVTGQGLPLLVEDAAVSGFSELAPRIQSFMAAPLHSEQGSIGVVVLGSARAGAFTREHHEILQVIANQAAAALSNASLHEEVLRAHRELALSQAQLVQSSKMAAVGQLAAGVAHEINTPLGSVLLEIESAELKLNTRPDKVGDKLRHAREAALACRSIISKLLFYSRDAVGVTDAVDLNTVARDTLEMFGRQLTLDGVSLHTELQPGLPAVRGNSNELQQVVTNLLVNARDAVRDPTARGRDVWLSTRSEQGRVYLSVRDSGPGIPPELIDRVLEPFFTTKEVGKGTGLGLSLSDRIVSQHGGELRVASPPGQGTEFTLCFPVAP